MAETGVEQGTGAHDSQTQSTQNAQEPGAQQPWREPSPAPAAPESPPAGRRRAQIIACVALVGGGALAVIRRRRQAKAKAQHQGRRHWPVSSATLPRAWRSRRAASRALPRKRRRR
jgi:hypothetical protein